MECIIVGNTVVTVGPGSGCMWSKHTPVNGSWMFAVGKGTSPRKGYKVTHVAQGNKWYVSYDNELR